MTTYKKQCLFIIIVICIVCMLWYTSRRPKWEIISIKQEYRGVIIEKYFNKKYHFIIDNKKSDVFDVTDLSDTLSKIASVGDTLFKNPNENYLYLIKKDGSIFMESAVFIEDYHRNSWEWPDVWKDKWLDYMPMHKVDKIE